MAPVNGFPYVSNMPGVDCSLFRPCQQPGGYQPGGAATCPFKPTHVPAPGITTDFPYGNASLGLPGRGIGGYKVPADGDTAHQFIAPCPNDMRGPCPGLNTAANHGFLARDGITTFNELVDAQQNVYNVGYDLAVVLALLGLTLTDGDIVTERLSIGCDATSRTSVAPLLTGSEPGLDAHGEFESDTSLTRNDYFLANGYAFPFNGTLFKMMTDTTCGTYDRAGLSKYRFERYQQSLNNPNFFFSPVAILLYGAVSFLYELMPSGPDYVPDKTTISSLFGAEEKSDGSYIFNNSEKIPDHWYNRNPPYDVVHVVSEIVAQYLAYPVLFGGATGNGGFDLINVGSFIHNGTLIAVPSTAAMSCLLYQLLTPPVPSN